MLGLLIIYFIWKRFADLALEHGKNKWAYGLSGIASYYAGTFLAGVGFGVVAVLAESSFLEDSGDMLIGIMALPFGILACWGLYKYFEKRGKQTARERSEEALDSELVER